MPPPSISFISSLHNCLPLTQAMLSSLEATVDLSDKEVVLVDDKSSDETPGFLQELESKSNFQILLNALNLGFAASNNRAAKQATGDLLVFINNDLEFLPGWLEPMTDALLSDPQIGAVGNVQRNFATGLIDHAGIFFDLNGMPTHAHKNRRNPPKGELLERNAATAACLTMRREEFLKLGGFDESYRNGLEDVDLCMKLKSEGKRIVVALQSEVRHHISVSPGRHENNERNTDVFREHWSEFAKQFGEKEWAREYFRRYARFWWRLNPPLAFKATGRLIRSTFRWERLNLRPK